MCTKPLYKSCKSSRPRQLERTSGSRTEAIPDCIFFLSLYARLDLPFLYLAAASSALVCLVVAPHDSIDTMPCVIFACYMHKNIASYFNFTFLIT